jgi:hypothetical protein
MTQGGANSFNCNTYKKLGGARVAAEPVSRVRDFTTQVRASVRLSPLDAMLAKNRGAAVIRRKV